MDNETKRTIKVLHVINSLETGGAERLLLDLTSHCQSEHVSLAIAYLVGPGTLLHDMQPKCEVFDLSRNGKFSPASFWELRSLMRRERIDILHTHDPQGGILGRLAARVAGVRTIVSTRHMPRLRGRHPFVYAVENRLLRGNTLIIAISHAVKKALVEDGLPGEKIKVIPNCVDTGFFSPALNQAIPDEKEPFHIRAVGRLEIYKGFDVLIRSFALLLSEGISATLEIAGEGPQREALMDLIRALGLTGHADLCGRLDRVQVRAFLAGADAVVLPSRTEGFGLSLLEAMAMGRPVVGSRIEGIAELVSDGVDGLLFAPSDAPDLAEKLRFLRANHRAAEALGAAGRRKAIQHFSLDRYAAQIVEAYEATMNRTMQV